VLGIPSGFRAEVMFSVGYADETPAARRRKTAEQMWSFNGY
jgi:hypothetical protein